METLASRKPRFEAITGEVGLAYADVYSLKTLENTRQNPQVTIAVINAKTYKGFQFKGLAETEGAGALLEAAKAQNPLSKTVTKVRIQSIYLLDYGPQAGEKVG